MGRRPQHAVAHDHGAAGGAGGTAHPVGTRDLLDARDLFERTLIVLCREHRLGDRLSPDDIEGVVDSMVGAFPGTVAELAGLVDREEWDEISALAARERTMKNLRQGR